MKHSFGYKTARRPSYPLTVAPLWPAHDRDASPARARLGTVRCAAAAIKCDCFEGIVGFFWNMSHRPHRGPPYAPPSAPMFMSGDAVFPPPVFMPYPPPHMAMMPGMGAFVPAAPSDINVSDVQAFMQRPKVNEI